MSSSQQPQEHPGPEWVHIGAAWYEHPVLRKQVTFDSGEGLMTDEEAEAAAVARCRAISAAALEWAYKVRCAERQAEREVPTMDLPQ